MVDTGDAVAQAVAARRWTRESGCSFSEYEDAAFAAIDPARYSDTSVRRYMLQYEECMANRDTVSDWDVSNALGEAMHVPNSPEFVRADLNALYNARRSGHRPGDFVLMVGDGNVWWSDYMARHAPGPTMVQLALW